MFLRQPSQLISVNRITQATNPDNGDKIGRYWYDDQGFRVRRISLRENEDGDKREHEVVYPSKYLCTEVQRTEGGAEIPDSYAVANNIYLNGVRIAVMVPDGEAHYYLTDQVDSVKVVADDTGKVVSRMEYLPYGETWFQEGEENHSPKYNSQELDKETGYYFYNARHYDAEIGRFVTADTVIDGQGDTQGWNRFSYVHNNPIQYKDPTGHDHTGVPSRTTQLEQGGFGSYPGGPPIGGGVPATCIIRSHRTPNPVLIEHLS